MHQVPPETPATGGPAPGRPRPGARHGVRSPCPWCVLTVAVAAGLWPAAPEVATGAARLAVPARPDPTAAARAWRRGDPRGALQALDALRAGQPRRARDPAARLLEARALEALAQPVEALAVLESVPPTGPLAAHLLSARADLRARLGLHLAAAQDYGRVARGEVSALGERARIRRATQLWLGGRFREAARAFTALRVRYPFHPSPSRWLNGEAIARLLAGEPRAAGALWRRLLLDAPAAPEAAAAAVSLAALRRAGTVIAPFTPDEERRRLLRLGAAGAFEPARDGLRALVAQGRLGPDQGHLAQARLLLSNYRYAEAVPLLKPLAARGTPAVRGAAQALLRRALARSGALPLAPASAPASARRVVGRRPRPRALALAPTRGAARRARPPGAGGLRALLARGDYRAAERWVRTREPGPSLRRGYFALRAGALARAATELRALLGRRPDHRGARYWLARTLEAQGQLDGARRLLEALARAVPLDWYALLARARISPGGGVAEPGPQPMTRLERPPAVQRLVAALRAWSTRYPRLGRAAALLAYGLRAEALHELRDQAREHLLANPEERRAQTLRPLCPEAAWRGVRHRAEWRRPPAPRSGRRGGPELEGLLYRAFRRLGDPYLANRFVAVAQGRPRLLLPTPFTGAVVAQAKARGLPPGRVWAVMTVESAYSPNVVSRAGAIGLLQLMPRTAARIAQALHLPGVSLDRLFEPETNLRFGVWYLAALLERFQGQLPLAVAAYNGGPHNVARWLAQGAGRLELDALVEEIPFRETRAYVKKVVGLAARYAVELGEPYGGMVRLSVDSRVGNNTDF